MGGSRSVRVIPPSQGYYTVGLKGFAFEQPVKYVYNDYH